MSTLTHRGATAPAVSSAPRSISAPTSSSSSSSPSTLRIVLFWLVTLFGPTSFVIGGCMALFVPGNDIEKNATRLGYPRFLVPLIGIGKLFSAIVITLPGIPAEVRVWGYSCLTYILICAASSHAAFGDPFLPTGDHPESILPPLAFLTFTLLSYALRPANRRP